MKGDIIKRDLIKESLLENISDLSMNINDLFFFSSMDTVTGWCSEKDLAKILQQSG